MNLVFNNKISTVFLALVFFSACGTKQTKKDKTDIGPSPISGVVYSTTEKEITFTTDQYRLADIETGTIEMRNLSSIIKLSGMIDVEPQSMATVSAPLGGYIKTAGLLPGQAVKKGQVLATLENPEFIALQQDYLESQGRLQYLEEEYKRQQQLREDDVNATKTFQQVTSEYKVMQARINGLEQKLALAGISVSTVQVGEITRTANLYAPISGYIKNSNINIGNYVNPNDVLFEIINTDDIYLTLNTFEKDMGNIEEGQKVKFSLTNENDFSRTAQVFLIGKATSEDRTIPIACRIQKESKNGLLPGMYVKAWIETGTTRQYAVPTDAIVQWEGKDYLILQKRESSAGYTFLLGQVGRGIEQEGFTSVELAKSIQIDGAKLVVKNAYTILSALKNLEEGEE